MGTTTVVTFTGTTDLNINMFIKSVIAVFFGLTPSETWRLLKRLKLHCHQNVGYIPINPWRNGP